MTTTPNDTITVPVADLDRASAYYEELLGSVPRRRGGSRVVLGLDSEQVEVHLVQASQEAVLTAVEDGTLDSAMSAVWRLTGGWTVKPGMGAVCCPDCAGLSLDGGPGLTRWDALRRSPLSAPSGALVLQSAAERGVRVQRTARTNGGIRVSFADGDLPDILLVGALQSPPAGSVPEPPVMRHDTIEVPFKPWARRRRHIITTDRLYLA